MVTWRSCAIHAICVTVACLVNMVSYAQSFVRKTYHDAEKKHLKENYQVKDTVSNIPHGRYISYYLNGIIESKGQFTNNETTGVWEFFYETGNLKMRGILRQNANYGHWEYFYESGNKSMEGMIDGRNREGEWKSYYENGQIKEVGRYVKNKRDGYWASYFEDGIKRGEIDYQDNYGTYTEYYHSGKVLAQGPKRGVRNYGHWRFFGEDGILQTEGDFVNGKKTGDWITYYPKGQVASRGKYENDSPIGVWEYFYEDGKLSSTGEYASGVKIGNWKTLNSNGSIKSEANFRNGSGEYREYYSDGKLKMKGPIYKGKKDGLWEYYYEDGTKEGECLFSEDKGTYFGYYPDGVLRTKGTLDGDQKVGTWELYERDGKLTGYYRPFYDDRKFVIDETKLNKNNIASKSGKASNRKMTYFDARFNEFRGIIVGGNPIMMFAGYLPISGEFYLQERLGHEFEFIGIRSPFFRKDLNIPLGTPYERGYNLVFKQKYYNQTKSGMWYFGQELRFTNLAHFVNDVNTTTDDRFTAGAIEQRIEYGLLTGYRITQRNNGEGFTLDAYVSANAGYRGFIVDPMYESYFNRIRQTRFVSSIHIGFNIGRIFAFR